MMLTGELSQLQGGPALRLREAANGKVDVVATSNGDRHPASRHFRARPPIDG